MTKVNKQGSHRPETKRKAGSPKPVEAQKQLRERLVMI